MKFTRKNRTELLHICHQFEVAFARSGYLVRRPVFIASDNPALTCAQLTIHADLGAGGCQDAHIEISLEGSCKIFVGKPYSLGVAEMSASVNHETWKRFEMAVETPDLVAVVLRKVRAMLLED